ncbi:MAG: hypothetical protein KBS59_03680 [Clostridiales bacterium]|nr:hypothetical protein [Clostridiales bacterium]
MKKIIALFLVALTVAFAACGCATNAESIKPLDYIDLGDYENFTYEAFAQKYNEARAAAAEGVEYFNVDWGYTVKFNVICEIVGGDDKAPTYTRYEDYCFEGADTVTINIYEDTNDAYRANFDSAFVYSISNANYDTSSAKARNIKVGTAFDFLYTLPYMENNKAVSGKTVRFTVTPTAVLPPIYDDNYIVDALNAFFAEHSEKKQTAEIGDIVTLDVSAKIDDTPVKDLGITDFVCVLGCSGYPKAFDEGVVGSGMNVRKTFDVTYPADWTNSEYAGKTVSFTVTLKDAYSYDKAVAANTSCKSLYEYKEALRLKNFIEYEIINIVYERSSLKKVHKGLYNEYYDYFKSMNEQTIKDSIANTSNSETKLTRDSVIASIWGNAAEYEKYLEDYSKEMVLQTLVCYAVADKLGIDYTKADYAEDIAEFAETYNTGYGTDYSISKIEKVCNKNILKLVFLEEKVCSVLAEKV